MEKANLVLTEKAEALEEHIASLKEEVEDPAVLHEQIDVLTQDNKKLKEENAALKATITENEKLLEEAAEVVEAESRQDIIWEAADVLYFLTVLLQKQGITIDDVLMELRRRRFEDPTKKISHEDTRRDTKKKK